MTSAPARRKVSIIVTASISSEPFATGTRTFTACAVVAMLTRECVPVTRPIEERTLEKPLSKYLAPEGPLRDEQALAELINLVCVRFAVKARASHTAVCLTLFTAIIYQSSERFSLCCCPRYKSRSTL